LYVASHQTAGRGRATNTWLDTGAGESLLSTWSFQCKRPPQAITGPRVGLALFQACRKIWTQLNWSLKAPNDLYLDGVKVAGLLIETLTNGRDHRMLIGLGLNVVNHPRRFSNATHLGHALGHAPSESDWFRFLDELKAQFNEAVQDSARPELTATVRHELTQALNANPARAYAVEDISPSGDILYQGGRIPWTDL
jgi:BirA family biotin operon repressor/biotin-[acetyl-CoA-carboxylase] ligase